MSKIAHMRKSAPDLIGIAEAAEIIGESRQHTFRRVQSGELPAQRLGTSAVAPYMIDRADALKIKQANIAKLRDQLERAEATA